MTTRLLMVDDDHSFRSAIIDSLCGYDCEVLVADNANHGLAMALDKRPDLIIINVDMESVIGEEILLKLKKSKKLKDIHLIVVTSIAEQSRVLKFAKLGIKGYFVRPLKDDELIKRIFALLNLQSEGGPQPLSPSPHQTEDNRFGKSTYTSGEGPESIPGGDDRCTFFSVQQDIQCVHIPDHVTKRLAERIEADLHPRILEMTKRGIRKIILDLSQVNVVNIYLIKIAVTVVTKSRTSNCLFRVVATPKLESELLQLSEFGNINIDHSIEEAREAMALL